MTWQTEFVKISKEPLFPTAPHCPFCDYKSDFNAKTGIHRHVKTKHPNHFNTRIQVQLAFIQDLLDRKAREIEERGKSKNIWVKISGRWYQSMQTIFKISQSFDEEDASLFFADSSEVEELSLVYRKNKTQGDQK